MKASLSRIEVKNDYLLRLTFSDGMEGVVDFSEYVGKGVFKIWTDYKRFQTARIGEYGELVWDGNIDFCPDALYMKIAGMSPESYWDQIVNQHA